MRPLRECGTCICTGLLFHPPRERVTQSATETSSPLSKYANFGQPPKILKGANALSSRSWSIETISPSYLISSTTLGKPTKRCTQEVMTGRNDWRTYFSKWPAASYGLSCQRLGPSGSRAAFPSKHAPLPLDRVRPTCLCGYTLVRLQVAGNIARLLVSLSADRLKLLGAQRLQH